MIRFRFRKKRRGGAPSVTSGLLEETGTDPVLDLGDGISKLLGDSLTLERLNSVRVGARRHDNERDDGRVGSHLLEAVVEARERLDEHVHALVAVLVATSSEEVERLVEVKVVVAVEVASDKVVDLLLRDGVQVLESTPVVRYFPRLGR